MVNGELRGCEWKALNEPKLGNTAESAGYQDAKQARKLVEKFVTELGKFTMEEFEERIGRLCKKVYAEAVADAWGEAPLYMRVDTLLDKHGRIWLGERESWGADINGNDTFEKMNPTMKELAQKMISGTKEVLNSTQRRRGYLNDVYGSATGKREAAEVTSTSSSAKRRRIAA